MPSKSSAGSCERAARPFFDHAAQRVRLDVDVFRTAYGFEGISRRAVKGRGGSRFRSSWSWPAPAIDAHWVLLAAAAAARCCCCCRSLLPLPLLPLLLLLLLPLQHVCGRYYECSALSRRPSPSCRRTYSSIEACRVFLI